jgi:DNA (cytosine-5)-methyltransferase 1
MPTLNAFDNGDVRTTVIVFHPHYHDGARVQGDTMNTLTSRMGTGGNNVSGIATPTNVRRLTPVECERLQGFPDDWTAGQSDSHRYKQMGNAVAVPVVEWIVQGIVDVAKVS